MSARSPLVFLLKAIVVGLAGAFVLVFVNPTLLPERRPVVEVRQAEAEISTPVPSEPFSYAEAVSRAAPAVVNIYTAKMVTRRGTPAFTDPLLQHFFGRGSTPDVQRHLETSLGSGVIVSPDGYILTNNHVIDGADEIQVMMADERSLVASVVGSDPETDLAVLRVRSSELPTVLVDLGAPPRVGDVALAIGNPFGVGQSVTMGIIGATGRDDLGINTFENFIQTDAAINPGNSGGALINARGDLVGINTAIFSKSGGSQGIGFAIPSRLAMAVMEQIIEHGHAVRGWLGIEAQTLTAELADSFGLTQGPGVVVAGVLENSPAYSAGLARGDIITHIDGELAASARDVLNLISRHAPGSRVGIRGYRGSNPFEVHAQIMQRPLQRP
jgi:serine protease DegS